VCELKVNEFGVSGPEPGSLPTVSLCNLQLGVPDDGIMSAKESCRIWLNCQPFLVRRREKQWWNRKIFRRTLSRQMGEKFAKRNQELKSNGLTSLTKGLWRIGGRDQAAEEREQ